MNSMSKTEDKVLTEENNYLRNLIYKQKTILQQLQIQKEHLMHGLKDTNIDISNLESMDSMDDAQWNILISTLPVFSQSELAIESFNRRRKIGNVDP